MGRPTKVDYLMSIARLVASRSTCDRKYVGAVLATATGHVLSTGYNGSSPGAVHCDDAGHLLAFAGSENEACIRTTHAEVNAVAFAARRGVALEGSCLYVTHKPCHMCARVLLAAGIVEVTFEIEGSDEFGRTLLEGGGVIVNGPWKGAMA